MSGWLPPGCTDKDIDDAAPQNELDDDVGSEAQMLGEEIDRIEQWVEEQCGKGYRVSMMLMVERIIKDNKLDRFQ